MDFKVDRSGAMGTRAPVGLKMVSEDTGLMGAGMSVESDPDGQFLYALTGYGTLTTYDVGTYYNRIDPALPEATDAVDYDLFYEVGYDFSRFTIPGKLEFSDGRLWVGEVSLDGNDDDLHVFDPSYDPENPFATKSTTNLLNVNDGGGLHMPIFKVIDGNILALMDGANDERHDFDVAFLDVGDDFLDQDPLPLPPAYLSTGLQPGK